MGKRLFVLFFVACVAIGGFFLIIAITNFTQDVFSWDNKDRDIFFGCLMFMVYPVMVGGGIMGVRWATFED